MEDDRNKAALTCFQHIPVWFKTTTLIWFSRGIPLISWDIMLYDKFRVTRAGNSLQIAAISCKDMIAQINGKHWYHLHTTIHKNDWIQGVLQLMMSTLFNFDSLQSAAQLSIRTKRLDSNAFLRQGQSWIGPFRVENQHIVSKNQHIVSNKVKSE